MQNITTDIYLYTIFLVQKGITTRARSSSPHNIIQNDFLEKLKCLMFSVQYLCGEIIGLWNMKRIEEGNEI